MEREGVTVRVGVAILACLAIAVGAAAVIAADGTLPESAPWRAAYARPSAMPPLDGEPDTTARVELGRQLFFDPLLSRSRSVACATCHEPAQGWGDGRPRGVGEAGVALSLRTPTLLNVAWMQPLGWDGKFADLESVAFTPITGPLLMNLTEAELIARLRAEPAYVAGFGGAFADGAVTRPAIEQALAAFQRTIVSDEAPFDRWLAGDASAMSARAKAGFVLFNGKAACAECHGGWAFTDGSFHDVGVGQGDDLGRGRLFPNSVSLRYAFKTPTLRDVARRAPYMHDGSLPTLRAVVDLYDRGGIERPSRSPKVGPLRLSEAEKADLLAFLEALTADAPMGGSASR